MASTQSYLTKRLTTGTTIINPKPGVLGSILINKALTGTVTVTFGSGASATTQAVLTNGTTAPLGTVMFGGPDGGASYDSLTVALSATEDVTVCYR